MSVSDFPRRTLRGRILALAGVALIVGAAMLGLWAAGVFETAAGEAATLVDTPSVDGVSDVGPLKGQVAPDFEITDFNGKRHRLSDYRGKVVYVNFWATWCVPCQAELPEIYRLHKEYGDQLVVIEVNKAESAGKARDYFDNLGNLDGGKGVSYTVDGIDPTATLYARYHTLPIDSLPISVFVDARGVVSKLYNGQLNYDDMKAAVEEALASG
jgi:thiol-disulfide isomerase/thioredoxin